MPVKLPDDLVHNIYERESKDRWGETFCGASFTTAYRFGTKLRVEHLHTAKHVRTYVTCLSCLGSKR